MNIFNALETRSNKSEMMDDIDVDGPLLQETLDDVERVNRLTFGGRLSIRGLASLMPEDADELTVLDVGTGNGGIARQLAEWGRDEGVDVRIDGIDLNEGFVEHARRQSSKDPNVHFEVCNLFDVDDDAAYDVVHASNMLHHLDDELLVSALEKMRRVADVGVVVADLHRHPIAWAAIRSTVRLMSGNEMVRHDAPLSVARGFVRGELEAFAREAGFEHASIAWEFPFRWLLIAPTHPSRPTHA